GRSHVTADEIIDILKSSGTPVAKSTVYRFLASLEESGEVRKYLVVEGSPACYQFIGGEDACAEHYHLMCRECGRIVHFDNPELQSVLRDTREPDGRAFHIDGPSTLFYGTCGACLSPPGTRHTLFPA
ncbi:MAG: transcriptional repressor, partial [Synergistaceae bacterium]|nr:transcriptional repressor [Synergistaceae bacterium]